MHLSYYQRTSYYVEEKYLTLKLDAAYQPLEIIDSLKAFSMVYSGRAKILENYNCKFNFDISHPSVIVLNSYVRTKPILMSPTRSNIYWRDLYRCQYCYNKFSTSELTLDHVIPKSRGGEKNWLNIVTACEKCNQKKGNKTPDEASMKLFKTPSVPKFNVFQTKPSLKIPTSWKKFI